MSPWIYDTIGGFGVLLCLGAFLLLQNGRLHPQALPYSLANFAGSLCIIFSLVFAWNLASFCIEVAWALVSFYGVVKFYRRRSTT